MNIPLRIAMMLMLLIGLSAKSADAFPPVEVITIEDVLEKLEETSPKLADAKSALARVKAAYSSTRALPNPRLFGADERVDTDSGEESEQTIGISQDLSFLWKRPQAIRSQAAAYTAAEAQYEEAAASLLGNVIVGFQRLQGLRTRNAVMDTVFGYLSDLSKRTDARLAIGEASAYDADRFQQEVIQFAARRAELRQEYAGERIELMTLTGFTAAEIEEVRVGDYEVRVSFDRDSDAIAYAVEHSPRLRAAENESDAAARNVAAAKWSLIPEVAISVGRKEITRGFSGPVLGAEIEIPVFGQGRSKIAEATAVRNAAVVKQTSLKHEVAAEIRSLWEQWRDIEPVMQKASGTATTRLDRATTLYYSGESSALELLDAMRSVLESEAARLALRFKRIQAAAELNVVTGHPIRIQ